MIYLSDFLLTIEMKKATGHYKKSYYSNLTSHLKSLVKEGKLTELEKRKYSLNAKIKDELRAELDK